MTTDEIKPSERPDMNTRTYDAKPTDTDIIREVSASYAGSGLHTVQDFFDLPEDGPRMELIDGVFYDMGEPTPYHQGIIGQLHIELANYIASHHGECVVMLSPIAVQLDMDDRTVVEPDLMIICDRKKFLKDRIMGAPDFVVEVLSPSTRRKDMRIKTWKYQNAGVREYWMVDPAAEKILIYDFEEDAFPVIYGFEDRIPVKILPGDCVINLKSMRDQLAFMKE